MKLLFDQNLSFKLCEQLADIFAGSSQARLLGLADMPIRQGGYLPCLSTISS
jgi:predicted nuclease of predicted toxin-antitoxin system